MKIAVFSDIHGNLFALNAVLQALKDESPDVMVCLGDVAADGAQSSEVIERLRTIDCRFVKGNADAELLDLPQPSDDADESAKRFHEIHVWNHAQLNRDQLEFLNSFEPMVSIPLDDGNELLCYHGSPYSFHDVIEATTPDEKIEAYFENVMAKACVGGHTHTPMMRRWNEKLLLNPGSVGLPYMHDADGEVFTPSWAEYLIIESVGENLTFEFRRQPYNAGLYVEILLSRGVPHAEWIAGYWRT